MVHSQHVVARGGVGGSLVPDPRFSTPPFRLPAQTSVHLPHNIAVYVVVLAIGQASAGLRPQSDLLGVTCSPNLFGVNPSFDSLV